MAFYTNWITLSFYLTFLVKIISQTSNYQISEASESNFSKLDLQKKEEVKKFEEAFYAVFAELHSNQLVRKIWNWDHDNKRLSTKIPYKNQIIFIWKNDEGEIKCSVAVNCDNAISQYSNFGFQIPAEKKGRYYEVLTLFTQNLDRANGIRLDRYFLRSYCIAHMYELGYDFMVSTCARKPLATYLRWGWEIMDEVTIDNEKRYFLYYNIPQNLKEL